jgi:hypothetical protein
MRFLLRKCLILSIVVACAFVVAGCRTNKGKDDFVPYVVRIYMEESRNLPRSHVLDMMLPISGSIITVGAKPMFAEWDILQAAGFDTDFGPAVVLLFTPEASRELYRQTISNQGRRLVFTVNGIPVGGRVIDRPVQDGRVFFFPEMDEEAVPELVRGIQRTSLEIQERLRKPGKW